jgi:hypothetical protein
MAKVIWIERTPCMTTMVVRWCEQRTVCMTTMVVRWCEQRTVCMTTMVVRAVGQTLEEYGSLWPISTQEYLRGDLLRSP